MDERSPFTHGIFISYKHGHKHLAGRMFDFFRNRGVDPFMDDHSLGSSSDYEETIMKSIRSAPYFLCLLTEDGLEDLCAEDRSDRMFYQEVKCALDAGSAMIIVLYGNVHAADLSARLPEELERFSKVHTFRMPDDDNSHYFHLMEDLMKEISTRRLHGVINWREYSGMNANVRMLRRDILENTTASFDVRFGKAFMEKIESETPPVQENRVREINISCYAGNIIFTPERESVDRRAYDLGMMFKVFRAMLSDPDFTLRLMINAPDSPAVADAIRYSRLGNNAFEECPEVVFYSAYAGIQSLMAEEPFRSARKEKRFQLTLTDCVMPYSLFHVIYKSGWEEFNHVKVDLYSLNLDSSVDRRSMLIFERDDPENYRFFVQQFEYLRNQELRASRERIRQNNDKWLREWEELRETL